MAIKIIWSKRADQGYAKIVKYLEEEWTDREVKNFVQKTNKFFNLLKENPYLLEPTQNHKHVYRGPIDKLTMLTYRYKSRKKEIVLVNVRSTRQKPLKK